MNTNSHSFVLFLKASLYIDSRYVSKSRILFFILFCIFLPVQGRSVSLSEKTEYSRKITANRCLRADWVV